MTIKDYQYIMSLDKTDELLWEKQVIDYLKVDTKKSIDDVLLEVRKKLAITPKSINKHYFWFKNNLWYIEKNLIELSYEQFARLDNLISEDDNINNLHKLLSIYVRPWNCKFSLKTQDKVYEKLLDLDINFAQGLLVFFFANAQRYMKYINIHYLNQMKNPLPLLTQNK